MSTIRKFKLKKSHERILLKEDCLKQFLTNIDNHVERMFKEESNGRPLIFVEKVKDYYNRLNEQRSFAMLLHLAFVWSIPYTPEGFHFWFDIFKKYYRK